MRMAMKELYQLKANMTGDADVSAAKRATREDLKVLWVRFGEPMTDRCWQKSLRESCILLFTCQKMGQSETTFLIRKERKSWEDEGNRSCSGDCSPLFSQKWIWDLHPSSSISICVEVDSFSGVHGLSSLSPAHLLRLTMTDWIGRFAIS